MDSFEGIVVTKYPLFSRLGYLRNSKYPDCKGDLPAILRMMDEGFRVLKSAMKIAERASLKIQEAREFACGGVARDPEKARKIVSELREIVVEASAAEAAISKHNRDSRESKEFFEWVFSAADDFETSGITLEEIFFNAVIMASMKSISLISYAIECVDESIEVIDQDAGFSGSMIKFKKELVIIPRRLKACRDGLMLMGIKSYWPVGFGDITKRDVEEMAKAVESGKMDGAACDPRIVRSLLHLLEEYIALRDSLGFVISSRIEPGQPDELVAYIGKSRLHSVALDSADQAQASACGSDPFAGKRKFRFPFGVAGFFRKSLADDVVNGGAGKLDGSLRFTVDVGKNDWTRIVLNRVVIGDEFMVAAVFSVNPWLLHFAAKATESYISLAAERYSSFVKSVNDDLALMKLCSV